MLNPDYLNVLRKIYARLVNTNIIWVLTGSLSFALQGIALQPHDIDLQSDEAGAYEIERRFSEFVVRKVTFSTAEKIRSHLGALSIDGIQVEVMGDISKRLDDGTWEEPVNLTRHKRIIIVEDMHIPILSLEYEYHAYLKLGRIEKAQILKQALQGRKGKHTMLIRTIRPDDAEQFLNLRKKLDQETQFMMLEPGERMTTVQEERDQIQRLLLQENSTIFVAEHDGQLVGYLSATGGQFRRNRHSVHIVIGILQDFTGQGIGGQLFAALEEWAHQKSITRLELTVMTHNQAGLALYKKRGFTIEGTKKHSLLINGQYIDEYYMAKLLD